MGQCDVCSRVLANREGYLLTTEQVVSTPKYWDYYWTTAQVDFHSGKLLPHFTEAMLHDPSPERTASSAKAIMAHLLLADDAPVGEPTLEERAETAEELASSRTPWTICNDCIDMFPVDRISTRKYAEAWYDAGGNFSPPGNGPVPLSKVDMGDGKTYLQGGSAEALALADQLRIRSSAGNPPSQSSSTLGEIDSAEKSVSRAPTNEHPSGAKDDELIAGLTDDDPFKQAECAIYLGKRKCLAAVPVLCSYMSPPSGEVRALPNVLEVDLGRVVATAEIARALGRVGDPQALPALIEWMRLVAPSEWKLPNIPLWVLAPIGPGVTIPEHLAKAEESLYPLYQTYQGAATAKPFGYGCPPQIFRTDQDMAGYSSLLVPHGTRTGANGKVLLPDAS